ncbi:MAG: hypothetical protein A4E56_02936 [Pelotomaculum sp. PtaU1.Bin065]|nr:MAG: hypothetical protein A4E56_02936 [Pelotomaculum sp. PtaU1.Bin065]
MLSKKARPPLPKITDPENSYFHPVFKYAAEEALKICGFNKEIEVVGQYPSGSGPIDFVFRRIASGKILIPIEIKRSKTSVRGLGRRQSRDYWNNLGNTCETPFYCTSNLELTELFRNDQHRPKTSAQLIKLTNPIIILGKTKENIFYEAFINCLCEVVGIVIGGSQYSYVTAFTQFQTHIENRNSNPREWHKLFVPMCFEYIRGAASNYSSLTRRTLMWKSAGYYQTNPKRLIELGRKVDFEGVFKYPCPDPNDNEAFTYGILEEASNSGKYLGGGDEVAEVVGEVVTEYIDKGYIETDPELANLLAIISKVCIDRELLPDEEIFDPCAGSGALLKVLPSFSIFKLQPRQIRANEINPFLAEVLSLRLGLAFAPVLDTDNCPKITIAPLETLEKDLLKKVRVVLMNPPFIAGIRSSEIKKVCAERIRQVSGKQSILDMGQIGYEALFLELVRHLVPDSTVIASVFPAQYLVRLSKEIVNFRQFLIRDFGLKYFAIYPRAGIFEKVIKQTVVLIGQKGSSSNQVKVIEIEEKLSNLDFHQLLRGLERKLNNPTHGVNIIARPRIEFERSVKEGWRVLYGMGFRADKLIKKYMTGFNKTHDLELRRGTIGNSGSTELTVFSKENPLLPSVVNLIPKKWLCPVLNTTDDMPRLIGPSNAPEQSFLPPAAAYKQSTPERKILISIIKEYLSSYQLKSSKQKKKEKSDEQILKILRADQKDLGKNWVIIPRGSRKKAEVGLLESGGVLLSTNVVLVKIEDEVTRRLLASWMLSIFGQLQLELYSAPQEGMRKLEIGSVGKVQYPDFNKIPEKKAAALAKLAIDENAIDYNNAVSRTVDKLWAAQLYPSDPEGCLSEAFEIFNYLVDERRSIGGS